MTHEEAMRLRDELRAQNAPSRGGIAWCELDACRGVFVFYRRHVSNRRAPDGTPHHLSLDHSDRERVLAHWAHYRDAIEPAAQVAIAFDSEDDR